MIAINGKAVFGELGEVVHPGHTALVIIDMQRDFIEPDGVFGRMGVNLGMYPAMRLRLAGLLRDARATGLLVVHVQMSTLPGGMSDSPAQIRFNLRMHERLRAGGPPLVYTVEGTSGHDFVSGLQPLPSEPVVRKRRSSAFWGTDLSMLLRANGIRSVVVAGCTTEGCVESTARDALFNDFYTVVAEDAVASDDPEQHRASLLLMRHRFDVVGVAELGTLWRSATDPAADDPAATAASDRDARTAVGAP